VKRARYTETKKFKNGATTDGKNIRNV